jgi:hypothetical protein
VRLRIVDSELTDIAGNRAPVLIWSLSKRYLHARLERFSYDLGASRNTLVELLRRAAPPQQTALMEQALRTIQVRGAVVDKTELVVPLALEVPDAWLVARAAPALSSAPLSEAELEALEKALEPWDAFLVYSIRQIAGDSDDSTLRKRLFTLLLDSRYRLVALLSGDAPTAGEPVRALFLETWNELRGILADAQRERAIDPSLLRYTLFIDGGDALAALERAAPGLDMRVSPESLRQIARSLRPGDAADPLAYDWAVDAGLRTLFNVEEVEQPPAPPPGRSWLDIFVKRAYAASEDALPALDRWVPTRDELAAYETRVHDLLQKTAAAQLERPVVGAPYDAAYRHLVPTTALIESCWRQYVVRSGKVSYLRSAAGSVGIMQINQHVWRGFYDIQRLRWDTAYNMRAGAKILLRYVKDYAVPYAEKTGDSNHVPRAAYAVYNAGPRAVGRFNKPTPHPREARVDEKLWTLYQGIAAGSQVDLASCGVKPLANAAR